MFLLLCPSMPDHHLSTTVQWCCKISEKPIVTTNNCFFFVLEAFVFFFWRQMCRTNKIHVSSSVYTALS